MDQKDKELLNLIQQSFPIESRPFLTIAQKLGITEKEVMERISRLKEKEYIRRVGAIFNSSKLGYVSTLCALQVPEERIYEVAEIINSYKGVTHNYLRQHNYNMWFTVIAESKEKLELILKEIQEKTRIDTLLNLPAVRHLKINVIFNVMEAM